MREAIKIKRQLEGARLIHITTMYVIALILFLFSTFPHRWWILLTILVISAAVEPGLLIKKSVHRMRGTLLSLILLIPLLYLVQLNYRLIPVVFIIMTIGVTVSSLNVVRYDVAVFFITITVFLLMAQSAPSTSPEGPFEMVINRGICTFIGIFIVISGDYILFNAYKYSQRLYLLHQLQLCHFLQTTVDLICKSPVENTSALIFFEKLREQVNEKYVPIAISAESLALDLKSSVNLRERISVFQETAWQMRRVIFALAFSRFVLKSSDSEKNHLISFNSLMQKARSQIYQ